MNGLGDGWIRNGGFGSRIRYESGQLAEKEKIKNKEKRKASTKHVDKRPGRGILNLAGFPCLLWVPLCLCVCTNTTTTLS